MWHIHECNTFLNLLFIYVFVAEVEARAFPRDSCLLFPSAVASLWSLQAACGPRLSAPHLPPLVSIPLVWTVSSSPVTNDVLISHLCTFFGGMLSFDLHIHMQMSVVTVCAPSYKHSLFTHAVKKFNKSYLYWLGVMTSVFNPSTWDSEAAGSLWVLCQAGPTVSSRASKDTQRNSVLKQKWMTKAKI